MRGPDVSQQLARLGKMLREIDWVEFRRTAKARWERFADYMDATPEAPADAVWPASLLRPKGNLNRTELWLLLAVAFFPLLMIVVRISAWPGVLGPGMSGSLIPSIGQDLNELLSLHSVPVGDRNRVLYMLFLPTGAMLIAFTRLTFGVRVIGFRAILISVGFQESGIVPSLILILVTVVIVISVRPTLVRFRLPYYGRVSVIMCLACVVLLCAVLLAPWVRSEILWGVAFFPVIVLGLLAEGIARTLDKDSGLTAAWRTGMTIGVALLLAGVSHIYILREIALEFPELVFTQIVAIILISEYLDLRLFQDWDARLSGIALPRLFSKTDSLRVAVIRNHRKSGVIGRMGAVNRGGYHRRSVRQIVAALRERGHTVKVFEGDIRMLSGLREFIPPHPTSGQPGGVVFNLAHGLQGEAAAAHVPAMLEMSGLLYTGMGSLGATLATDRIAFTAILREAGLSVPECHRIASNGSTTVEPKFPVVVKPRFASRYKMRVAKNRRQFERAVQRIEQRDQQEAVFETYIDGREFEAVLVGNTSIGCLALVEVLPGEEGRVCPAALDAATENALKQTAFEAFRACSGRDYGLVNLRLSNQTGVVHVLEVTNTATLEPGGAFALAADLVGWTFAELVDHIVMSARNRMRPALGDASDAGDSNKVRELKSGERTTVVS